MPTAPESFPVLISARAVTLSMEYGNCPASGPGYSAFAITLWAMGSYELAYRFSKLGLDLVERLGPSEFSGVVRFSFGSADASSGRD